jgi:hypothetical protein
MSQDTRVQLDDNPRFYTYEGLSDATYRFELRLKNGDTVIGHRVAFDSNSDDAKRKIAGMIEETYPDWKTMRILTRQEFKKS